MRRTAALAALSLTLLAAAGCDGSREPTTSPTTAAAPTASADTTRACAQFQQVFAEERMTQLGVSVGQLLAVREAGDQTAVTAAEEKVQQQVDKLAADVTTVGVESGDAELKAKLDQVAAEITKARDLAFLEGVKGVDNLEQPFTQLLTTWILPVAATCDLS
jgi:hypothetical protein